jgi:DNA replication and repair protein RecF
MRVTGLEVQNFRNYENVNISLCEGINVLCGKNGQGKTNLLEGVYYGSALMSFRGAKDKELVRHNQAGFQISINYNAHGRDMLLDVSYKNGKKEIKLNGIKRSNKEVIGSLCAVLFAPEHLDLIKGAPVLRRRFMDLSLCRLSSAYYFALSQYKRSVEQKSALLKQMKKNRQKCNDTLDIWNQRLAHFGGIIAVKRAEFCKELSGYAKSVHYELSCGKEDLELLYLPSVSACGNENEAAQAIYRRLCAKIKEETESGSCLIGCHRDDLGIIINGKAARIYASQGQQRSGVFAIKMAECEIFKRAIGEYPILLLDDILSELDEERKKYIINNIEGRQVLITCCEKTEEFHESRKIFNIENGQIS